MLTTLNTERLAEQELSRCRNIRRTETSLTEFRALFAFSQGMEFAGKPLPVTVHEQTAQQIELLLMAELIRLKRLAA